MRKLLLSLAAVVLGLGTMNAARPEWSISGDTKTEINKGSVRKAKAQDASSDWLCRFFTGNSLTVDGLKNKGTYRAAVVIPEEIASQCVGSKITEIVFYMGTNTSGNKAGNVFITDGLGGETIMEKELNFKLGTISGNSLNPGENIITLDEPYVFDGKEVAVGYTFSAPAYSEFRPYYPLCYVDEAAISGNADNICMVTPEGDVWDHFGSPWSIMITVEGENLPLWAQIVGYDMPYVIKPGESTEVSMQFLNMGAKPVTSITASAIIDGVAGESKDYAVNIAPDRAGIINVPTGTIAKSGYYSVDAEASKVNDMDIKPAAVGDYVKVIDEGLPRKMVVEEWTGTWCGFCPMGIWGMEYMTEKYPDDFIGIAVHSDNEFDYPTYINSLMAEGVVSGFPGAWVDRMMVVNPGPTGFENAVKTVGGNRGFAAISLDAVAYEDEKETTLGVTTSVKVGYDAAEVNELLAKSGYRIAYVIVENDLPGVQQNYYSGGSYGKCGGWERKGREVEWNFTEVARLIDVYDGVNGSVPETMEKNKEYEYTHSLKLPGTIEKKNNIDIIALLISTIDGHIENAAKIHGPMAVTAIDSVGADAEGNVAVSAADGGITVAGDCVEAEVYGLNGVRVASLHGCGTVEVTAGLYIVRTVAADGTVSAVKVAVR